MSEGLRVVHLPKERALYTRRFRTVADNSQRYRHFRPTCGIKCNCKHCRWLRADQEEQEDVEEGDKEEADKEEVKVRA